MGYFCLDDYDCIAFDMDHTVIQYHLPELKKLIYRCLVEHLKGKDYDLSLLSLDNYDKYQDFCVKGVILDYTKGNFIKIDNEGYVLHCLHGLSQLSEDEIIEDYGTKRLWSSFSVLQETMINGPGYALIENYYVTPAIPLISILVANADAKNCGRLRSYLPIWKDVVEAFDTNFSYTSFKARRGMFMPELIANPEKYVKKCPPTVVEWLKGLRKTKLTALITHTFENLAEHLMCFAFGKDWKEYFDFIVGHANKPKFFQDAFKDRPFYTMNADEEISVEEVKELLTHKFYLCGNSHHLEKEVQRYLHRDIPPKFVYFGDSIRSDIHAPSFHCEWDTVTILEEIEGEEELAYLTNKAEIEVMCKKTKRLSKEDKLITVSKLWGSFFFHPNNKTKHCDGQRNEKPEINTFFGKLVQQHSKLAIPLLDYIAELPVEHRYIFSEDEQFKFHPFLPRSLNLSED